MADTDLTYDVLNELYFVTSYSELKMNTGLENNKLVELLILFNRNGWIRCYEGVDNEIEGEDVDIRNLFDKYHYLASKEGLFAHNSR